MESHVSAYRSHSLSLARHTSNSCSFSHCAARMPIPSLLPQRASRFLLFVFSAAQAHTNPYSCLRRRASAHQSVLFVFGTMQGHTNLYSLSSVLHKRIPIRTLCLQRRASAYQFLSFFSADKRIPIRTLCVREFTHVCTSQSQGERGPRPRACSSWPLPTARYGAAANVVVPIASIGLTGSTLLPRSSPQPTTLAAEVLLPLLPPT